MTVNYTDIIDLTDLDANPALKTQVIAALLEIEATTEGQLLFEDIENIFNLDIDISVNDTLAGAGQFDDLGTNDLYINPDQLLKSLTARSDGNLDIFSLHRLLVHELYHASDTTPSSASHGDGFKEHRAVEFANLYMEKYYGEAKRVVYSAPSVTDTDAVDGIEAEASIKIATFDGSADTGTADPIMLGLITYEDQYTSRYGNNVSNPFYQAALEENNITLDSVTTDYEKVTGSFTGNTRITGNDTLNTDDVKVLYTYAGDDVVTVSGEQLSVAGDGRVVLLGEGDDIVYATGGDNTLKGGLGNDKLDYSAASVTAGIDINLESGEAQISGKTVIEKINGFEQVIGTAYVDTITGNVAENVLKGGSGQDVYHLNGAFGDDVIVDDGGVLLIDGEAPVFSYSKQVVQTSDSEFEWSKVGAMTLANGTVISGFNNLLLEEVDRFGNELGNTILIENYFDNILNWNFDISVMTGAVIKGTNLSDILHGTSWGDFIIGKSGQDFIQGHGGNDTLVGGAWADFLVGGAGSDVFRYRNHDESRIVTFEVASDPNFNEPLAQTDTIWDFTRGEDKLDLGGLGFSGVSAVATSDLYDLEYTSSDNAVLLTNVHYNFHLIIIGTEFLDNSDVIGLGTAPLLVEGDNDANILFGGEFNDILKGYGGNDVFRIFDGSDIVYGGLGNEDKVVFRGDSTEFGFSGFNAQTIIVHDLADIAAGEDGLNTIYEAEILEFNNLSYYWSGTSWDLSIFRPPEANDDGISTAYGQSVTIDVLFNDSDKEDDQFFGDSITINSQPANGSAVVTATGAIIYSPNSGHEGNDSFSYTLTDSNLMTDTATVTVFVGDAPPNVAPSASADVVTMSYESTTTIDVLSNDVDDGALDGGSVTIDTDPLNGTVLVNLDGTITYTPNTGYDGADSFVYAVTDADGVVDTATVNVTVNPVPSNYAPDAADDTTTVDQDASIAISVLANDSDTEDTSFTNSNLSIHANPTNGAVSVNGDGTITYTPSANYVGVDSFAYMLTDSGGETDIATVNLSVQAVVDTNAAATHNGDAGNNYITAGSGADVLFGYEGDDTLYGVAGDDQLVGGLGVDTLWGYKGNDTYVWKSGDGNDLVQESNTSSSGTDQLHFTGGITLADLNIYGYTSHDLKIEYIPTGEVVTITNQYAGDTDYLVESLTFDDGSSYNLVQGVTWLGGVGNQNLSGSIYDDVMHGGKDNDTLNGGTGNDTLLGDLGDDTLYGYKGDDTYVWQAGRGNDVFIEQNYSASANDVLHLTGGITFNDLKLYGFTSHDLKIEYVPTGELLTIQNQYYNDADYHIETLLFDDGSSYNLNQAVKWLGGVGNQNLSGSIYDDVMHGGKDNDTVSGGAGNDTLLGDLGDDTLYGYTGDDTYVWQAGRGNDVFIEQNHSASANDVLYLKGGITFDDIQIYGYTSHDMKIKYLPTGEVLTLQNQFYNDSDYHIETLQFDNGTTYNLVQGLELLGGAGNESLEGSIFDDVLQGNDGNDTLKGAGGADTLIGGTGDDSLYGYTGDDTYVWQAGDGNDVFVEQNYSASANDVLHLTGGLVAADVSFSQSGYDLLITVASTSEVLTIDNQYYSDTDYHIETLLFDNGSTVDLLGV